MTFVVRAICSLILTAILAVGTASAQTWPSQTITAIIPFAPGNG
jgi:tripartite-type tricarboxylate transporter receptor subunit TctC